MTTTEQPTPDGTDQSTEPVTAETAPPPETPETDAADDQDVKEAQKYRRRAQAAEADRDTLATRLEALQRSEVERIAGETTRAVKPAAVWAADGFTLDAMLDEDGNVDQAKVIAAARNAAAELGLQSGPRVPRPSRSQGARPDDTPENAPSWSRALNRSTASR